MTHPASGNPTWQDYPSTQTPITALALEQIETAIDTGGPAVGGSWGYYGDNTTNQSVPANTWTTMVPGSTLWASGVALAGNGSFTVAEPGVYRVDTTAWWNTGTGLRITCIGPTGNEYAIRYGMARQMVSPSADLAQTVSAAFRVTSSDTTYGVGLFSAVALTVSMRALSITRVGAL